MSRANMTALEEIMIVHDYFSEEEWILIAESLIASNIPKDKQNAIAEKMPTIALLKAGYEVSK